MATVSVTICKPGTVWKMSGDVYQHFSRKALQDRVRSWYAFVCANLQPTTHLSDVSRERAIMLYALMTGTSIDVGRVIYDHYMYTVRAKQGGIGFPSLITNLCSWNKVSWLPTEEKIEEKIVHEM